MLGYPHNKHNVVFVDTVRLRVWFIMSPILALERIVYTKVSNSLNH